MKNVLLKVENFSAYFKSDKGIIVADREINLNLYQGEIIGIVGESGSGKSVLAKAIIGYLEKRQTVSGNIYFYHQNQKISILNLDLWKLKKIRREFIFYYPQNSLNIYDPFYHAEIEIQSQLNKARTVSGTQYRNAEEVLAEVNLDDKIGDTTGFENYSGGQKQLTLLAEIVANPPKIAILDEPTTAIDQARRKKFVQLIKKIQEKSPELSFIIISHDIELIRKAVDRIYVMYGGEIVEEGSAYALTDSPAHPYTMMLLNSVPKFNESFQLLKGDKIFNNKIENFGQILNSSHKFNQCVFIDRCPMHEKCIDKLKPTYGSDANQRRWKCYYPFLRNNLGKFIDLTEKLVSDKSKVLLEIKNVSVGIAHSRKKILKNITLQVYEHDRAGIVGGSGEGKTTLLKTILHLDRSLVLSPEGKIFFDDIKINEQTIERLRNRIQYIPQVFEDSFLPNSTVYQTVTEALHKNDIYFRKDKFTIPQVMGILDILGLKEIHSYNIKELSGGQKQRVAIARALIALELHDSTNSDKVKLLLMDEPTSSLDVTLQANVFYYLDLIQQQYPISYLIISHDLPLISGFCKHFYVIYQGRIVDHVQRDQVKSIFDQNSKQNFHDYTKELFGVPYEMQ